jgi:hypothetical protein
LPPSPLSSTGSGELPSPSTFKISAAALWLVPSSRFSSSCAASFLGPVGYLPSPFLLFFSVS